MKRTSKLAIATAATLLVVQGGTALYAQDKGKAGVSIKDKYTLVSPSGVAFADFKGYEDWSVVSSARTDEVLKVIVANPIMIHAYK